MDSGELDYVTKMYKVWQTVLGMLVDRGYNIAASVKTETPDSSSQDRKLTFQITGRDATTGQLLALSIPGREKVELTKEIFMAAFVVDLGSGILQVQSDKLRITARMPNDHSKAIMVFFCPDLKMNVDTLRLYHKAMSAEMGSCSAIIVLHDTLSPMCRTKIREIELKENRHIELFKESELVVDITKHVLVPRHVVLSEREKKEVLERYHVTPEQLPKIKTTDPIARHYGMHRDDIVKIIRFSETAGQYVVYRYVV